MLQEGEVRPVGATAEKQVNVRIVAATNRNLEKEVAEGRFREDLYYRLKVFPLRLPPLRERREDIPLLAEHFLERYAAEFGKPSGGFTQQAMELLQGYDWPGNVRELQNEVQRLVHPGRRRRLHHAGHALAAHPPGRGHARARAPDEGHAQGDDGSGRALAPHRGAARAREQQDGRREDPRHHARGLTRSCARSGSDESRSGFARDAPR